MPRQSSKYNKRSVRKNTKKKEEQVIKHTPEKSRPSWAYTLKEGGNLYPVKLPTTEETIERVKNEVLNPNNWRKYLRHPQGGNRNYTQLLCFPPFEPLRVSEVYFPNGDVWSSSKRELITKDNQSAN